MARHEDGRGGVLAGAILIALGAAFLAMQFFEVSGGIVVLGLGLAFLVGFFVNRAYGLLVPGGILTGLGTGIVVQDSRVLGEAGGDGIVLLGLGLGFLSIWLLNRTIGRERWPGSWWPLIPGGILVVVGVTVGVPGMERLWQYLWPVVLIGIGAFVLLRALRDRDGNTRASQGDAPPPPPRQPVP